MKEIIIIATDVTPDNYPDAQAGTALALAPVQDVPFLSFVLDALEEKKFSQYIFAITQPAVQAFVKETYPDLPATFCLENKAMAAVAKAFETATEEDILTVDAGYVANFDEQLLNKFHQIKNSTFTTVTRWVKDVDGLTSLTLNQKGLVTHAEANANYAAAYVYTGVSIVHAPTLLMDATTEGNFSGHYLQQKVSNGEVFALEQDGTVVSIVTANNFAAAQESNL
ncbi:MAG: hypothetical protein EAY72_10260 [Bacteroidetes bacterium]|nr:MAG: hypothetical protein EAY72_10260 [Bacteroidota bacterium]TAE62581.1 MAG: hypothetical protein EAY68_08575 [Bacteroidota bacterium]